jgi:hypothetical protein
MVFDNKDEQGYVVDDFRSLIDGAKRCMPVDHVRVLEHFYVLAKTGLSTQELQKWKEKTAEVANNG